MADRSFERMARDLSADFSALRDDLRKLTDVISDLANENAEAARSGFATAVGTARDRVSDAADRIAEQASYASGRVKGAGAQIESRIERNPMAAVMVAVVGGLLIGALMRSRR